MTPGGHEVALVVLLGLALFLAVQLIWIVLNHLLVRRLGAFGILWRWPSGLVVPLALASGGAAIFYLRSSFGWRALGVAMSLEGIWMAFRMYLVRRLASRARLTSRHSAIGG